MKNSRNFGEKCEIYRSLGWEVDESGHATKIGDIGGCKSTVSRTIVDNGCYDGWLPLPDDAATDLPEDHTDVLYCLNINKRIAAGEIRSSVGIRGSVPSAWIDYAGIARNEKLYNQAKADILADMRDMQYYRRVGSKFVKV